MPTLVVVIAYLSSFWFLALSLKTLEVGNAYAIWAGAGTALVAIAGIIFFEESVTFLKAGSIILIIIGVFGLNYSRYNLV